MSFEEASTYAKSINASYFELSAESGRNCEAVYRQIVEQIIDAKYAYWKNMKDNIKAFLWHDTKQLMAYASVYIVLSFICSFYYALFYFLIWKLYLESLYDYCDQNAPAYVLIQFFGAVLIIILLILPVMVVKKRNLVFIFSGILILLTLVCAGLLIYFDKQV